MGKSRIFLIGLVSFLAGVAITDFFAVSPQIGLAAVLTLAIVAWLASDRPIKMMAVWGAMLLAGLVYPGLLGREQLVSLNPSGPILTFFASAKEAFLAALQRVFQEPYGAFAQGLAVGSRSDLPKDIKDAFITTGTIHIVAVSGQNFTIVLRLFAQWTSGLGRRASFILGSAAILGFILLIGGQGSVVRAAIMGWLFLLAPFLGRLPNITIALFFTAAVMVLFEPKILTESLNFQLSFLSMLGLIAIEPRLQKFLDAIGWRRFVPKALRDGLTATLAAQIATLGLILARFGRLSLVAPLPNMLIAPVVPLAMIGSLLTGAVALVSDFFGQLLAFPISIVLKLILEIIELFASVNLASLNFEPWPWWWLGGYYAILVVILWITKTPAPIANKPNNE